MKKTLPLNEAKMLANRLRAVVRQACPIARIEFAGSLRREEETIGDIDMLIDVDLVRLREVDGFLCMFGGNDRAQFTWEGIQIDAWRVKPGCWGSMLFAVTGPKDYFVWYARKAQYNGMKLSPHGLFRGSEKIAGEDEPGIYIALGKEWKEPRLRGK